MNPQTRNPWLAATLTVTLAAGWSAAAGAQTWVAASDGAIPDGAVDAGSLNGKALTICRASAGGGVHPGKIRTDGQWQGCKVTFGGAAQTVTSYEVLTDFGGGWEAATQTVPETALEAGNTAGGGPFYVCRYRPAEDSSNPGKLNMSGKCTVGERGQAVQYTSYDVLVSPPAPTVTCLSFEDTIVNALGGPFVFTGEATGDDQNANGVIEEGELESLRFVLDNQVGSRIEFTEASIAQSPWGLPWGDGVRLRDTTSLGAAGLLSQSYGALETSSNGEVYYLYLTSAIQMTLEVNGGYDYVLFHGESGPVWGACGVPAPADPDPACRDIVVMNSRMSSDDLDTLITEHRVRGSDQNGDGMIEGSSQQQGEVTTWTYRTLDVWTAGHPSFNPTIKVPSAHGIYEWSDPYSLLVAVVASPSPADARFDEFRQLSVTTSELRLDVDYLDPDTGGITPELDFIDERYAENPSHVLVGPCVD